MKTLGLLAGNGQLPFLFADAARAQGLSVHAVGFQGDTDPSLASHVASFTWMRLGQTRPAVEAFQKNGVTEVVLAGGIGRVRSLTQARPDLGMLQLIAGLRSFRDDELLRAVARYFEKRGLKVVAPTDYVPTVLAPEGHLAGPPLTDVQRRDVQLGREVALTLGRVDVGQTVVVHEGVVLAVEAVEGTDECIRRAGKFGKRGAVVVKRCKPNQDLRFDLPAAGPVTMEVMREAGAKVLALEAGKTVLLDSQLLFRDAAALGISIVSL